MTYPHFLALAAPPAGRLTRAMACSSSASFMPRSRYRTCSTGASKPVSSIDFGFEEARGGDAGQRADGLADAAVIQPRPAVRAFVDDPELGSEPFLEDDLAEAGAVGLFRVGRHGSAGRSAFEMRPAHMRELIDQRLLDLRVLRPLRHVSRPRRSALVATRCVSPYKRRLTFERAAKMS